jgi:putative DNA primase/helicase
MIAVQVWPHASIKGWGGDPVELRAEKHPRQNVQVSLEQALGDVYDVDAHAVPYALYLGGELVPEAPRMKKASLPRLAALDLEIRFGCAFVDVDYPDDRPVASEEAIASWYAEQCEALFCSGAPRPAYRYRTKGGYRLVYELSTPCAPDVYEPLLATLHHALRDATGGEIIPCKNTLDWTHCYRLPAVARKLDGGEVERQLYPLEPLEDPDVLDVADAAAYDEKNPTHSIGGRRRFAGMDTAEPRGARTVATEGGRNNALASIAGSMRASGLSVDEILPALEVANQERCDPPLDDAEVEAIARSIGSYKAPDPVAVAEAVAEARKPVIPRRAAEEGNDEAPEVELVLGSEAEIADVVVSQLERGAERLRYDRGRLWRYSPDLGVWTWVRASELTELVVELDGCPVPKPVGKGRIKLKVGARMCMHVRELVEHYRDAPDWLTGAAAGVAFAGGVVVKVRGGALEVADASPSHRLVHCLPFEWDPKARAPLFEGMLERAFRGCSDAADRIELFLGFVGTSLIGRATAYQKALVLAGDGANGKSALVDVVAVLVPPGARASVPPQRLEDSYMKAELVGVLLNIVSEVPESDIVSGAGFKALIAGDEQTARRIRESPFSFRAVAGHLWVCNSLPGARDFSTGFWRRWLAIEFPNAIPEEEQIAGLAAQVAANELPGVARLVLEAAARVEARGGYVVPESSRKALEAWRRDADQVASFAEDRLEVADDLSEAAFGSRLYEAYQLWTRRNGHKPLSNRKFGERLRLLGFHRAQRTANGRRWLVRIRPSHEQPNS